MRYFARGLAYQDQGNLDLAIANYSEAISLESERRRCLP